MAFTAASAQARFHLSNSTLVANATKSFVFKRTRACAKPSLQTHFVIQGLKYFAIFILCCCKVFANIVSPSEFEMWYQYALGSGYIAAFILSNPGLQIGPTGNPLYLFPAGDINNGSANLQRHINF
jgi:hypothetical protein